MDLNSIKNPQVREYIRKKLEGEQNLSQAQDVQSGVGYANVAGNLATDLANSNKQDVILGNRLDSLGRAPKVVSSPDEQYNDMGASKLAAQGVGSAERNLAGIEAPPTVRDEEDPGSPISKLWQDMATKIAPGKDFSAFSASQMRKVIPSLESRVNKEKPKTTDPRAERPKEPKPMTSLEYRQEEDLRGREVPGLGTALTKGDASTLKNAAEMKSNFDRSIDEMLALRKKHNGGALFAREDVARGKQLSKQLLLSYKNLAKLGVLSQADEAIINAIIPKDPLAYAPGGLLGEDPISHKLAKFKSDSDAQFNKSQEMRLQGRQETAPQTPGGLKDVGTMSIEELEAELGGS
jgi:hypothetical protein